MVIRRLFTTDVDGTRNILHQFAESDGLLKSLHAVWYRTAMFRRTDRQTVGWPVTVQLVLCTG